MGQASRDTAGSAAGGPGRARYLIGVDENRMASLGAQLAADPRVRVVRRPAAGILAVETVAAVVEELRAQYADSLLIEEDRELETLPPVGPGTDGAEPRS